MTDLMPERTQLLAPPAPLRASELHPLLMAISNTDVLGVMEVTSQLGDRARHTIADRELIDRLDSLVADGGVGAIAAVEILGALIGADADERLIDLLDGDDPTLRRHASWRLGGRRMCRRAIPAVVHELQRGGIDTFHAHRTLRAWSLDDPAAILRAATTALAVAEHAGPRARLIDVIGAVDDRGTDAYLVDIAVDEAESDAARIAAIGALGGRRNPMIADALAALATADDLIGAHAALALEAAVPTAPNPPGDGLRIAQLVLAEGLDGGLSRGGRGDTGGVASLLVSVARALETQPAVDHVVTIGRGTVSEALLDPFTDDGGPSRYGTIALGDPDRPVKSSADAWEHVPALERGLRRSIQLAGGVDLLHLRMADAATLIGCEVADAAGIATCFSLAPDPHHVIRSLHDRGELDAQSFGRLEADQHLWLRARLIEQVGRSADRIALFPRVSTFDFMDRIDALETDDADDDRTARRSAVVAEGIDLAPIRLAETTSFQDATTSVLDDLEQCIPAHRRGLPLLVTVGRLHPVKGIERVAAAWWRNQVLRDRCNLVIVGGDLDDPSPVERHVIDAIDHIVDADTPAGDGIVMLGGRAHADVARLLVGAARGRRGVWSAGGVYVDGALKEEFGLAVLEAMAAGLPVVAPSTGGPSTYVDDGDTGVLVDPADDLSIAIIDAYDLVERPGRAERARTLVEADYSVNAMAEQLVDLYRGCER